MRSGTELIGINKKEVWKEKKSWQWFFVSLPISTYARDIGMLDTRGGGWIGRHDSIKLYLAGSGTPFVRVP